MNRRDDMITVFVVRRDEASTSHEFLQLHRAREDYLGGTWQIVRGGANQGELFLRAALRELKEETGLIPAEFYRLGTVECFYTDVNDTIWHSVPFCAVVEREQAVTLNDEHTELRWIPRSKIDSQTMWASERLLLKELCRDILDGGVAKEYLRIHI